MTRQKRTTQKQLESLTMAAECLKTLAHPHRLRIVQLLLTDVQYTVNELAEVCGIAQPMMSDHLRLMQRSGFLTSEKRGRSVHYSIAEPSLSKIMDCVESRFGL